MPNARQYWLIKQEPESYSWDDFVRDKGCTWDGVRNYQARNNLRGMKKGDLAFFYHSVTGKEVVGVAKVTREAYADPNATEGDWSAVDFKPVKPLKSRVSLEFIKSSAALKGMLLVRNSRLSVMPVTPQEFGEILKVGKTAL